MSDIVRFIHTADLHLDSPLKSLASRNTDLAELIYDASQQVLRRLVDLAIEESVDAVLIAGDLFDGDQRDVRTAMVLQREFKRLDAENIPVFIIWGNHDAEAKLLNVLDLPDNVYAFDGRGSKRRFANDRAVVHGVSFAKRQAPESLLGKYPKPEPNLFNIGMLHTSLTGADGHNNYAPCSVGELIDMGYDYWALGHIHKRSVHHDKPAIVMPGNPLGRHINESGERSVSLVTLEPDTPPVIHAIKLAPTRFERVSININDIDERRDAYLKITQALNEFRDSVDDERLIVRIELEGVTQLASRYQRDHQALFEQLSVDYEHRHDLWIDSVDTSALQLPEQATSASTNIDDMTNRLQSLLGDHLINSVTLRDTVDDDMTLLVRALPPELKDMFGETPEATKLFIEQQLLPDSAQWMMRELIVTEDIEAATSSND